MSKKGKQGHAEIQKPVNEKPAAAPCAHVALRDFVIHQNEYHKEIKAGDDVSDVPAVYLANLIAEGVIKGGP